MEYTTKVSPNGVVNYYPILEDEERKELQQDALKTIHEIIQKYKNIQKMKEA